MTGDPDKEYRTSKPPPARRVQERSREDIACPSISQNPSCSHPSWLSYAWATRKDSELEWLAKDHPETNPIPIKQDCEPRGRAVLLGSLTYCSPPGHPFPIKSLALSACVSLENSFPSVRQEPSFGPWKGSPFLQQNDKESICTAGDPSSIPGFGRSPGGGDPVFLPVESSWTKESDRLC